MNWKSRRERRLRKRLVDQSNPDKILASIQKKIHREKIPGFWTWLRSLYYKSHDEKVLNYAKEVLKK